MHIKRTLINVYLYCYAPLTQVGRRRVSLEVGPAPAFWGNLTPFSRTQSAIELLICVPTCSDPTCPDVLYIDFGVACDSSEHRSGFIAAVVTP